MTADIIYGEETLINSSALTALKIYEEYTVYLVYGRGQNLCWNTGLQSWNFDKFEPKRCIWNSYKSYCEQYIDSILI